MLVSFSVMSYIQRVMMSIAGPEIMKQYSIPAPDMGLVYSAFVISYSLTMVPGGGFVDKYGPKAVLTAVGLLTAAFTGLTALAGSPGLGAVIGVVPALIVMRLGLGVGTSPLYPACGRMIHNWISPSKRGRVWGWTAAGAGFGGAITPVALKPLLASYSWPAAFVSGGLLTFALVALWMATVSDYPSASRRPATAAGDRPKVPWKPLFANRNLRLLTIGYFAVDYFEYIFFYWLFYYFGEVRRVGPDKSALYTSYLFLAFMIMSPLGGFASDVLGKRYGRFQGRKIVSIVGLALSGLLLYAGIEAVDSAVSVTLLSLALGFASAADVPYWATVIDLSGDQSGAAGGIMNAGGNLGGAFAPYVTPLLAVSFGWSAGLLVGCLAAVIGAVVWFFIDPKQRIEVAGAPQ